MEKEKMKTVERPEKDYQISKVIGVGGFGSVYKAVEKKTKRKVAIKITKPLTLKDYKSVKKEIEILKDISGDRKACQSIVKLYDAFYEKNTKKIWMVLEHCEGGSFSDLMNVRNKPFKEKEIGIITKHILLALRYLHSKKIIHRDVKPSNILVSKEFPHIRIADFGLSSKLKTRWARRNSWVGTSHFLAPELITSANNPNNLGYSKAVDIWALGITLIQMAELVSPYSHLNAIQCINVIPNSKPPTLKKPEKWSPQFNDFLSKCLKINPFKRSSVHNLIRHDFIKKYRDGSPEFLLNLLKEKKRIIKNAGGEKNFFLQQQKNARVYTPPRSYLIQKEEEEDDYDDESDEEDEEDSSDESDSEESD